MEDRGNAVSYWACGTSAGATIPDMTPLLVGDAVRDQSADRGERRYLRHVVINDRADVIALGAGQSVRGIEHFQKRDQSLNPISRWRARRT